MSHLHAYTAACRRRQPGPWPEPASPPPRGGAPPTGCSPSAFSRVWGSPHAVLIPFMVCTGQWTPLASSRQCRLIPSLSGHERVCVDRHISVPSLSLAFSTVLFEAPFLKVIRGSIHSHSHWTAEELFSRKEENCAARAVLSLLCDDGDIYVTEPTQMQSKAKQSFSTHEPPRQHAGVARPLS